MLVSCLFKYIHFNMYNTYTHITFLYAHFMGNGYLLSLSSIVKLNLVYATVWN